MNKTLILFLALCCLLFGTGFITKRQPDIRIFFNGAEVVPDQTPVSENDYTLLPARFIFEMCGMSVTYDNAAKTVMAKDDAGGQTVEVAADSRLGKINGVATAMDTPARLVNDRMFVPVRFVVNATGLRAEWNPERRIIAIATPDYTGAMPETSVSFVIPNDEFLDWYDEIMADCSPSGYYRYVGETIRFDGYVADYEGRDPARGVYRVVRTTIHAGQEFTHGFICMNQTGAKNPAIGDSVRVTGTVGLWGDDEKMVIVVLGTERLARRR